MRASFRASFARDLRDIADPGLSRRIAAKIEEVEQARDLSQVQQIKKLRGAAGFYRLRVGEYRIGVQVEGDVVVFVRCLNRKEIYRFFP